MTGQSPRVSAVKLALQARQIREQVSEAGLLQSEPLAIVGMGCRFPGGATSPDRYWDLLKNGVDAITEVPRSRFDVAALYDPDPAAPGKMSTRWGGFLDRIDEFDPTFFGIAPREAASMDPQQRLLLEVAWEALEDAGQTQESLGGSQTGVFVGVYGDDYRRWQMSDTPRIDAYTVLGTAHCTTCGRLSFLFDLRGPSLVVDTGCSSSLVAVHLAAQSLRAGECRMALAAGINLILSPEMTISLSKWGFMAADGRCKTFDARADGFVRSEGCGAIVMKRLADALADHDRVLAVIRGTAVNEDGRSTVLTAPSGTAQQAVVQRALANGRVDPSEITYVEAHGTGTALGDPIEVEALAEVLGRPPDGPSCLVGSVKSNLGHLEAAAGIAGLIKTVLALQHEEIPPHLHLRALNPHISVEGTRLRFSSVAAPWRAGSVRRLAGVSSFGFGGTNAHVVIEEAPPVPAPALDASRPHLLALSGRSAGALNALAASYAAHLRVEDPLAIGDVCYTAAVRRTHHEYRLAVVGASRDALVEALEQQVRGERGWSIATAGRVSGAKPGPVLVFSGQGPQWWGMGRELLAADPTFKATLEEIAGLMDPISGWSLLAELTASESASRLQETEIAQPALVALQIALASTLAAYGVQPSAVVGHSVGEVAAACVAGSITREQAARIAVHRGRLMQRLTGMGRMVAVSMTAAEAESVVRAYPGRLSIAALNAPRSVVLSGETAAVLAAVGRLEGEGRECRMLPVNYAFHSYQMVPLARELGGLLDGEHPQPPRIPVVSTVTGRPADARAFDALYWTRNLTEPVRLAAAIESLARAGHDTFVEIGPHPVLTSAIGQCLAEFGAIDASVVSVLHRGRPDLVSMYAALGRLHAAGHPLEWSRICPPGRVVSLPTYAWQRERYWIDRPRTPPPSVAPTVQSSTLIGRQLTSPSLTDVVFETTFSGTSPSFLADHRIHGVVLCPATVFIAMAIEAATQGLKMANPVVTDLSFDEALGLDAEPRRVQIVLAPGNEKTTFTVLSRSNEQDPARWIVHARGAVRPGGPAVGNVQPAPLATPATATSASEHYALLASRGCEFGESFRGVLRVSHDKSRAVIELDPAHAALSRTDGTVHPSVLDACFQGLYELLPRGTDTYLPVGVGAVRAHVSASPAARAVVTIDPISRSDDALTADVVVVDAEGHTLVTVEGLVLRRATKEHLIRSLRRIPEGWLHAVRWEASSLEPLTAAAGSWLVLADAGGIGSALAGELEARGCPVRVVYASNAQPPTSPSTTDPVDRSGLSRLLRESGLPAPLRVIHAWSLDLPGLDAQEAHEVQSATEQACGSLLALAQAAAGSLVVGSICVLTRGGQATGVEARAADPRQTAVIGLARTLALEHPELTPRRIDLESSSHIVTAQRLADEMLFGGAEPEVALRGSGRLVPRLDRWHPLSTSIGSGEDRPVRVEVVERGVLDNMRLVPAIRRAPGPGEVEVRVRATGLNFRDVLNVLGMYSGPVGAPGIECAGTVTALGDGVEDLQIGEDVVGLVEGCFATFALAPARMLVRKPPQISFAEAATVPSAFMTASLALREIARVQAGDRVLIHAAAGGVGLAAVQIAQRAGAELFVTAGSEEKRAQLEALGVRHVMSSRTLEFADDIMRRTAGKGVDVVLNSLAGDFIPRSLDVLAPGGRFVEIGRTGIWDATDVAGRRPDVTYAVMFLLDFFAQEPDRARQMLSELLVEAAEGSLRVLPATLFPLSDVVAAFRHMAHARHIGKVVVVQDAPVRPAFQPYQADATYLITGALGALGLRTARAIVERGGRHLLLVARRQPSAREQDEIGALEATGARVTLVCADIVADSSIEAIRSALAAMPSLRGVVHAAGVLQDGVLAQQSAESLSSVLAPKVAGAWNLHQLTRSIDLDFFVMFSGAASMLGSSGQSNYSAANAFLDGLAAHRVRHGLPGLAINWSAWSEGGMAASLSSRDKQRFGERGMTMMAPAQALLVLEHLIQRASTPVVGVLPIEWHRFATDAAPLLPFLSHLVVQRDETAAATEPQPTLTERLGVAAPAARGGIVESYVRSTVVKVLGLPSSFVLDANQGLRDVGLDSLMAVELRNLLQAGTGELLPATLAFDYPTVAALTNHLVNTVLRVTTTAAPASGADDVAPRRVAADVSELTEEEAEIQLAAELGQIHRTDSHGN